MKASLTGLPAGMEANAGTSRSGRGRLVLAGLLLLSIYLALACALINPRGYLGGDTGGKVATLRSMERTGRIDAGVGYWAAAWDPDGRLHPLYSTVRLHGQWVNVGTLPALVAAVPLFRLGGMRAVLLLPMVGAVLAAFAARALARHLTRGSPGQASAGAAAFWTVGLASPVTVYALDFSEHTMGMALVGWAVVHLLVMAEREEAGRSWWSAPLAGLLLGAAATLRTEAFVYAAIATAVTGALIWSGRRPARAAMAAAGVAVGLAVPLLANALLEQMVLGGGLRGNRAAAAVRAGAGQETAQRLHEAALTLLAMRPTFAMATYLMGAVLTGLVVLAVRARHPRAGGLALAVAAALYLARFADGLGFVPGLLAASPLAAVGLAWALPSGRSRVLVTIAVLALPMVWALQYLGGMRAQWAGRYLLSSGLLLGAVAATRLPDLRRPVAVGVVALAVAVTATGVVWHTQRSHAVAAAAAELAARPEPVLVSRLAYLGREAGWYAGDLRWLTAVSDRDLAAAVEVVRRTGLGSYGLIERAEAPAPSAPTGFRPTTTTTVDYVAGTRLRITTFERPTSSNVRSNRAAGILGSGCPTSL